MILLSNVNLPLDTDFSNLADVAAKRFDTDINNIKSARLYRRSVDARRKNNLHFCCSILIELYSGERNAVKHVKTAEIYVKNEYVWPVAVNKPQQRPVIVGFGPAGMFAALTLAKAGLAPIVFERGRDVDSRVADVNEFMKGGKINPDSNIQFGEGGAGTFSDGKLNTGIKDPRCRTVLKTLYSFGAPEKILYQAKPHIGTDILVDVVRNLRNEVIRLGGEIRFSGLFDGIRTENGRLTAISVNGEYIGCDRLILATGHSARDTFGMLRQSGIAMIRKPFAMGVRIEHLQSDINRALYGDFYNHPALGAADYKLAVHLNNGRGVYTFCMCPGGEVVNASSEPGGIAVNGMSKSTRAGRNANSALLVGVDPADIPGEDVLAGCELQRDIERKAFEIARGAVPVMTVGEFVYGKPDSSGKVAPTVKPAPVWADFSGIFPSFVTESLKEGIVALNSKLNGFADPAAILSAPETRSSSPVRILRRETYEGQNLSGFYPCGEGAGYAGGIMSAAVDGMRVAEAVISSY